MNIIAKNIEMANCVAVFGEKFFLPEPSVFISLFKPEELKGANFADDPVMRLKVFDLPTKKFKYIFENDRARIEDYGFREPKDSGCAEEIARILVGIYEQRLEPVAFGFNYDTIYRFDNVLPQREILLNFITASQQDDIKNFGWQYTIKKENGRRIETYFFKAVSPIELRVHANFHFNATNFYPKEKLQQNFNKCYTEIDEAIKNISFINF